MFKPWYKQLINVDLSLPTCAKSLSIATASSFAFSAITSFPQLLKHDTNMVVPYYHIVPYLQRCYASLATSNAAQD